MMFSDFLSDEDILGQQKTYKLGYLKDSNAAAHSVDTGIS